MKRKVSCNLIDRIITVTIICSFGISLCSCSSITADFDGQRFGTTKKITVLVDSTVEGNTDVDINDSDVSKYIHDRVLDECNIDIEFVDSDNLDIVLGLVADISYTDEYNDIITYYRMGDIVNLYPYLKDYSSELTFLTSQFDGFETCSYIGNQNEIWCITPKINNPQSRITFIRKDWLDKLGLDVPANIAEFHNCLVAFRDNADVLLGDEANKMIPFFIDSEPNISAKPLLDSFLDTSISDRDSYMFGYCRAVQPGYADGLRVLNSWYLEGLLPVDYQLINPSDKESYESIEAGYVGSFCSTYDYLYIDGENSHAKALKDNCGNDANYIPINTFADSYGEYNAWAEGYIDIPVNRIFIPSTCSEPLACLVYLNWISNPQNIEDIKSLMIDDLYTYDRYLLTNNMSITEDNVYDLEACEYARQIALDVNYIQCLNLCVQYGPYVFKYVVSETDYDIVFPESTKQYVNCLICSDDGCFDANLDYLFSIYLNSGTGVICTFRNSEWDKVLVRGDRSPV